MADRLSSDVGSPSEVKDAIENSATDAFFRKQRALLSTLPAESQRSMLPANMNIAPSSTGPTRRVYDAQGMDQAPGQLMRSEGQAPTGDTDVDRVYDSAGHTWQFYYNLFSRNSIDNAGLPLIQTVHYRSKYNNAIWTGTQMMYGDGDGQTFGSFTSDLDIIGHELTHGIVQYECRLAYRNQSGALNESLADVFGIMIKMRALSQNAATSNWLIGENVLLGNYAIRSMKSPGTAYVNHPILRTDPQPSHMSNIYAGSADSGGVHINSGIPNHAFYLAAVNTGGNPWDRVGRVWYAAMCDKIRVPANADFQQFRAATEFHAENLFPGQAVVGHIKAAWKAVGL